MADVLADTEIAPEAPLSPTHVTIRREDYRPPDWLVPEIRLDFALDGDATRVRALLSVTRNGAHDRPLRLDGDGITPAKVLSNGQDVVWRMDGPTLVIDVDGDEARIETGNRNVVSRIIQMLTPSTPTV